MTEISRLGVLTGYPATSRSAEIRISPLMMRPISVDVPPTSKVATFGNPALRAIAAAAATPADGPERQVLTGICSAVSSVMRPPPE